MNPFKRLIILSMVLATATTASAAVILAEDIVKLHRAGVSEDIIVQAIELNSSTYALSQQDIEALKRDGLSDRIIAAMQKKSVATAEAPAVAPAADAKPAGMPAPSPNGAKTESGSGAAVAGTASVIEQPPVRAEEVVRATPVYTGPVGTYQYVYTAPPPPAYYYAPAYYYGPGYYYEPWHPAVSFSFGYYSGGHSHHGGYRGGHGGGHGGSRGHGGGGGCR